MRLLSWTLVLSLIASAVTAQTSSPAYVRPIRSPQSQSCSWYYPTLAIRLNEQGRAVVAYRVKKNGSVDQVRIAQSSGFEDLDYAAITCLQKSEWKPAKKDGEPIDWPQASAIGFCLTDRCSFTNPINPPLSSYETVANSPSTDATPGSVPPPK